MNKSQEEKTKEIYNELTKTTPVSLQKKLIYIQKINEERIKMQETTYEVEYLNLKRQYDLEYEKCYNEMSKIVKGELYPKISSEEASKYEITNTEAPSAENGIEDFWLTALSHASNFVTVNANDEKILKHLTEVKVVNKEDCLTFSLEFHFTPNDYFNNGVLTKTYLYDIKDHQCHDVESTKIEWKSDDKIPNTITKTKTVKKGKGKTETKLITKHVESFFDMFTFDKKADTFEVSAHQEEGEFFKDDFIPFSMEYFLNIIEFKYGDACDDEECDHDH